MSLVTRLSRIVDFFLFFMKIHADKILKFTSLRKEDANYAKFLRVPRTITFYICDLLSLVPHFLIPLLLFTMYI